MSLIKVWSYGRQGSNLLLDYLNTLEGSKNLGELFSYNHGTKKLKNHLPYLNSVYGSPANSELYNRELLHNMRQNPIELLSTLEKYFASFGEDIILVKIMMYDYNIETLRNLAELPGENVFLKRKRINTFISKCKAFTTNEYSGYDYSDIKTDWITSELLFLMHLSSKYRKIYNFCTNKKVIDYEDMSNLGISYVSKNFNTYEFDQSYITKRKKQNSETILRNNFKNPTLFDEKLKNEKLKKYLMNYEF